MSRLLLLLAAICLLATVLAGCSSKSERLYRRAETFLAQGQFEMAAEEYFNLVEEHPRSPLADAALYKLAYIHAEELGRPSAALVQYRRLADEYPASPYADDALMRIMAIQRRVLNDPVSVRRTWEELCSRFPDRRSLCARGLVEVLRAHFDAEQYELAATVAEELLEGYADQVRHCSQAALLRARAVERLGAEQAEVEKLYEAVIEQYPDTHAAAMAMRSIGWIYYGKREEQEKEQAEQMRQRSRVIAGVPAYGAKDGPVMEALSALHALLVQRGESVSVDQLATVFGVTFVTVFDPERPSLARSALPDNPLEMVAGALGFTHNTWSNSAAERAFETVHHALLQGHPVLIRYGSPARWVVVTGYDIPEQRVHLMQPDRQQYSTVGREQFLAGWRQGGGSGSGAAGSESFYQFSLGARLRTPAQAEAAAMAIRRAAQVMQLNSAAGAPAGKAAWEAASRWLETCAEPEAEAARARAVRWAAEGLTPQLAVAQMALPTLRDAEERLASELVGASARYEELLREAQLVARKIDEAVQAEQSVSADTTGESTEAEEDASLKWRAAAAQASYVAALHTRLAEQLAAAASRGR